MNAVVVRVCLLRPTKLCTVPCNLPSAFHVTKMYRTGTGKRGPSQACLVQPASPPLKRLRDHGSSPVFNLMLVSDLDSTMVDHSKPSHASLLNFNCLWEAEYAHNSLLVYSTGRSLERFLELKQQVPLLTPSILILSVGTEILYGPSLEPDVGWEKELDDGWNRDIVVEEAKKFSNLRFQDEPDQGPHKVSFKLDKREAPEIQTKLLEKLQEQGLKVKLIYSGGVDMDVLPYKAGKGYALSFLLNKMREENLTANNVLVCGDSGNDLDLFTVEGVKGVIVANAHVELLQWYQSQGERKHIFHATKRCAGGIMEALQHFDIGPYLSARDRYNTSFTSKSPSENGSIIAHGSAQREVVEFNSFFEKWLNGEVPNTEEALERLTVVIADGATMVYPTGKESNLLGSILSIRNMHGIMKDNEFTTWIDNIKEKKLADGVYLVTWESWEQVSGERRGYFATAVFLPKAGTPNGVAWLRCHETARMSEAALD